MKSPPANPARHIAWAIVSVVIATFSFAALFFEGSRALHGDVSGQRTAGFILVTPFLLLACAAICVTLAIRSSRVWRDYIAHASAGQRQDALDALRSEEVYAPLFAIGSVMAMVALAGWVFLFIGFDRIASSGGGFSLYIVMVSLITAGAYAVLDVSFARLASRRRVGRRAGPSRLSR